MTRQGHQLRCLEIGDEPTAWAEAGFTVAGDRLAVGGTVVHLVGHGEGRGIRRMCVDGIDADLDGMPFGACGADPPIATDHPNRVVAVDHVVALSPDMARTTAALEAAGLGLRRTRTFGAEEPDGRRRQCFFWLGDVILELTGSDTARDRGPAVLWGLALTTDDLDGASRRLGELLGRPRPAVQAGRRIATLRTRDLDISVPIALMTPHVRSRP